MWGNAAFIIIVYISCRANQSAVKLEAVKTKCVCVCVKFGTTVSAGTLRYDN